MLLAPLASLLLATGCQSADVGQACAMNLQYTDGTPIAVDVGDGMTCAFLAADFFRSGAVECDNLICLETPVGSCTGGTSTPFQVKAYCSKACISDDDCFTKDTGLVCRPLLLDPSYVASLPDGGKPWMPEALGSSYCAFPPP